MKSSTKKYYYKCDRKCKISLLKENKLDEAGKMLFENNPLTTVCSLVCNHEKQCEGHCVLGRKGTPVHFSAIENYISSAYVPKMVKGPAESNGKKVATVADEDKAVDALLDLYEKAAPKKK